jgi:hypothetical protein
MSASGTKRTSGDVRYLVANRGKRTSRRQPNSVAIDPLQTSDVPPNILPSTGLDAFQVSTLDSYTAAFRSRGLECDDENLLALLAVWQRGRLRRVRSNPQGGSTG